MTVAMNGWLALSRDGEQGIISFAAEFRKGLTKDSFFRTKEWKKKKERTEIRPFCFPDKTSVA
ncbi:MAG: hypothetical protein DMG39_20555 [Acidobacteria bacterium]|nr:MAG: hypothetical protein DMG39_20555 [Acidobacteriota bacterium]